MCVFFGSLITMNIVSTLKLRFVQLHFRIFLAEFAKFSSFGMILLARLLSLPQNSSELEQQVMDMYTIKKQALWVPLFESLFSCGRAYMYIHTYFSMHASTTCDLTSLLCAHRFLHACVLRIYTLMLCRFCFCTSFRIHVCLFTFDFSWSDWFAALIIATLFFWQTQQRSLMGLSTMMWGTSFCHISQNVEYASLWCVPERDKGDSRYKSQMLCLVVLDSKSCKSE